MTFSLKSWNIPDPSIQALVLLTCSSSDHGTTELLALVVSATTASYESITLNNTNLGASGIGVNIYADHVDYRSSFLAPIMSQQDKFITQLTQIVICQLSEKMGNSGIRQSALNTLTEVVQRFIQEIGSTAASYANASSRTQCNYFDIELALAEVGYDISDLAQWENNSNPCPMPIDIGSLETSYSAASNNTDSESIKMRELQTSIAMNKRTRNGTVIFDSEKNILEILEKETGAHSAKRKKGKSSGGKKRLGMKHVPPHCPDYPDGMLYKHTPIYWKGAHHGVAQEEKGAEPAERKEDIDNFEKTRKILIAHSGIFSAFGNKDKHKKRKIAMLGIDVDQLPPAKRQKMSDKMENDADAQDDGVEILENKYVDIE